MFCLSQNGIFYFREDILYSSFKTNFYSYERTKNQIHLTALTDTTVTNAQKESDAAVAAFVRTYVLWDYYIDCVGKRAVRMFWSVLAVCIYRSVHVGGSRLGIKHALGKCKKRERERERNRTSMKVIKASNYQLLSDLLTLV